MLHLSGISIFLLVLAFSGYFLPALFSYVLLALSWLVIYPILHFVYKINALDGAISIFIFSLLQIGIIVCKDIIRRETASWKERLAKREEERDGLLSESRDLSAAEEAIREKELSILNLYEVTKRMSEVLRFDDIFRVFSSFLKENFAFRKCSLLILAGEGAPLRIERIYDVRQSQGKDPAGDRTDYEKIAGLFSISPHEIYISRGEDGRFFKDMGIEDEGISSIAALPLLSENKTVAVLVVENLRKGDFERFLILAAEFALEIKKVLLYEMVERLAITDSLTGLYLRRHFLERLDEELNRSRRFKFKFAFLMVDIDDFKRCNDSYGHLVGDVVLKEIARIIKENLREIDLISRYGGEEFAIVLPETGPEGAMLVAERIRKKIGERVFKAYDEDVAITISAGVAVYPDDSDERPGLIENADSALYEAKKSGKNVVYKYKR